MINSRYIIFIFFFFNDTATTEIYTLSLHDALPIYSSICTATDGTWCSESIRDRGDIECFRRSEEHTSELQSLAYLVCRLLLEKKKHKQCLTLYQISPTISDHTLATSIQLRTQSHIY